MEPATTVAGTECLNCHAIFEGRFCPRCGQKIPSLNPSFREFLHDLLHEFVHVDGRIFRSIRLLLTEPGRLTREFFEGRRARYSSPLRLYLVFSALYFTVAFVSPVTGPRISCSSCPSEVRAEREAEMREAVARWVPRAAFLLVPLFGGLVALTTRRSGRRYPQHLYFALHVHAAWFALGAIAAASGLVTIPYIAATVSLTTALYAIAYLVMAFRRVYSLVWLRATVRSFVVLAVYWLIVAATVLSIALSSALRPV